MTADNSSETFVQVYERLAADAIADIKQLNFPQESVEHVRMLLDYTVPGGKMNRGLMVMHTYKLLKNLSSEQVDSETAFKINALGWCVEWLQAFFLVADDIMDHSKTRRGQPCWYLRDGIGNIAINDSFLLEACIYKILKKYFRNEECYVDLLELFHEVSYQTELGQLIDLMTAPEDNVDLNRFSSERYFLIVQYKTAYYSFYLPVALAMRMAGIKDEKAYEMAKDILIPLGNFFQVQDDYLDCYGDPSVIGKIGTDIQDNKCSWLVNQALKLATPEQRSILEKHYGRKNADDEKKVKELFKELNLENVYWRYEEKSYQELLKKMENVDESLIPRAVFVDFAKRIYKRQK